MMGWNNFADKKPKDGQLAIIKTKNHPKEPWMYAIGYWYEGRDRFVFPSLQCPQCQDEAVLTKYRPMFGLPNESVILWKVFDEQGDE